TLGFGAACPMAHTFACLRIAEAISDAGARLATGSGGLTLGRAGFAPAGRYTKFHEVIASSLPFDRHCLVALICLSPPCVSLSPCYRSYRCCHHPAALPQCTASLGVVPWGCSPGQRKHRQKSHNTIDGKVLFLLSVRVLPLSSSAPLNSQTLLWDSRI